MQSVRLSLLGCAVFLTLAACAQPQPPLQFDHAVIRQAAPGMDKSVAYVTLVNHTNAPIVLTQASSPVAGAIEFHESREVDGLMRMRRLTDLPIPAGESVQLQPGGKHLMLFRLAPLQVGQTAQVTFTDAADQVYTHEFVVVPLAYQP